MLNQTAVVCSLVILSFLSIVLNSIALYLIISRKSFYKKPSSRLILNLLYTHLFQAVFVIPLYAGKKMKVDDFRWAQFFSNGFRVTYFISFYVVVLSVLAITTERFLATYLMSSYKIYVTIRNVSILIVVVWIYVFVLCTIPFIPHVTEQQQTPPESCINGTMLSINKMDSNHSNTIQSDDLIKMTQTSIQNVSILANLTGNCTSLWDQEPTKAFYIYIPQNPWTLFMLFVNAALPLLMIILCYVYIIHRLRTLNMIQSHEHSKKFQHVTHLSIVLISIYCILWTPSIIYYTVLAVCEDSCFPKDWDGSFTEKHTGYIIKYLAFLNSLLSPIIYCYFSPSLSRNK